jgi:hypothetical protein
LFEALNRLLGDAPQKPDAAFPEIEETLNKARELQERRNKG